MWTNYNPWILLHEFNSREGEGEGGRVKGTAQQIAMDLFSSFILDCPEWKDTQWMLDIIARQFNMISAGKKNPKQPATTITTKPNPKHWTR